MASVMIGVRTDPEPQQSFVGLDRQYAITQADSYAVIAAKSV
jgi:hypothetical protein